MYKLAYRKEVEKTLKKIKRSNSKKFVEEFKEIFKVIAEQPENGQPYVGNLEGFYKYVHGERPQFRIIYQFYSIEEIHGNRAQFEDISDDELEEMDGLVDLVFLRTREDCNQLYKESKAYFKAKKRIESHPNEE